MVHNIQYHIMLLTVCFVLRQDYCMDCYASSALPLSSRRRVYCPVLRM